MSETIELDENTIIGNPVVAENSVKFKANSHGNILFCEDGTDLRGSTITFNGDNALVYLSKNRLIGQKVCPEQLFTLLRTGTLSCDAIRPRQAPLPISAERRPRLP